MEMLAIEIEKKKQMGERKNIKKKIAMDFKRNS